MAETVSGLPFDEIDEFNWNTMVSHPLGNDGLTAEGYWDLGCNLAASGAVCTETDRPIEGEVEPSLRSTRSSVLSWLYCLGEIGLLGMASAYLVLVPLYLMTEVVSDGRADFVDSILPLSGTAFLGFSVLLGAASLAIVGRGVVLSIVRKTLVHAFIAVRVVAFLGLRPLVMGSLFLFTMPLMIAARGVRWFAVIALATTPLFIPLVYATSWLVLPEEVFAEQWSTWDTVRGLWPFLGLAMGASVAVVVLGFLVHRLVGPVAKVVLDVVRYTGDAEYRASLQKELDQRVQNVSHDQTLILVTHSLGTVIAMDSLCNSCVYRGRDVVLITMGSPIRRFFCRFFPNMLFPADPCRAGSWAAAGCGRLRWVNCYRPLDPIGTRLGIDSMPWAAEVSTRQWGRVLSAHPDYWGDRMVRDAVEEAVSRVAWSSPPEPSDQRPGRWPSPRGLSTRTRDGVVTTGVALVLVCCLLAPLVGLVAWGRHVYTQSRSLEDRVEATLESGTVVNAAVEHWDVMVLPPTDRTPASFDHRFKVTYQSGDGPIVKELAVADGSDRFDSDTYLGNLDDLREHVRAACQFTDEVPSWKFDRIRHCVRDGIRVAYDPNDPDVFAFVNFQPARSLWNGFKDVAFHLFVSLFGWALIAVLMLFLLLRIVAPLLGLRAISHETEA